MNAWMGLVGLLLCGHASWAGEVPQSLSLQTATAAQLAGLPHVDASLAASIVALRTERGTLSSVEALRVLPGAHGPALDSLRRGTVMTVTVPKVQPYANAQQVLAQFDEEPSIQQVQQWANSYARTSPETVRKWMTAAQGFAALPELSFEVQIDDDWGQDFDYVSGQDGNLEPLLTDADIGQNQRFKVKASWKLGDLIMSSNRIRVMNETQDAVKLRDSLLTQVNTLYFDRRRHQVDMLLRPRKQVLDRVKDHIRLMELTARIDALTGGAFSDALSRVEAKGSRRTENVK